MEILSFFTWESYLNGINNQLLYFLKEHKIFYKSIPAQAYYSQQKELIEAKNEILIILDKQPSKEENLQLLEIEKFIKFLNIDYKILIKFSKNN